MDLNGYVYRSTEYERDRKIKRFIQGGIGVNVKLIGNLDFSSNFNVGYCRSVFGGLVHENNYVHMVRYNLQGGLLYTF